MRVSLLVVALAMLGVAPASAQEPTDPTDGTTDEVGGDEQETAVTLPDSATGPEALKLAEEAHAEVNFERAGILARQAIERGGLNQQQLAQAHNISAEAYSLMDDADAAKLAFIRALAADPDLPMNTALGPKLQGPFLEARGFWANQKLTVDVDVVEASLGLSVRLEVSDPSATVTHYRLGIRRAPVEGLRPEKLQWSKGKASSTTTVGIENMWSKLTEEQWKEIRYFELVFELHDAHGNVVRAVGDPLKPERHPNPRFSEPTVIESLASSPWFWTATGVVVVGAGVLLYAYAIAPPDRVGEFRIARNSAGD